MWPFKKKLILTDTDIVSEWLESGELNALPDNEQRVYDAFVLLQKNCTYFFGSILWQYIETYNKHNKLRLVMRLDTNCANISRKKFFASVNLNKAVVKHIYKVLQHNNKLAEEADWKLPTKWSKPKKKGK